MAFGTMAGVYEVLEVKQVHDGRGWRTVARHWRPVQIVATYSPSPRWGLVETPTGDTLARHRTLITRWRRGSDDGPLTDASHSPPEDIHRS